MKQNKTKEAILDAAIELISSVGFERTSLKDITAKLGIKAPSIYNYYSGKQEILNAIYSYYTEHFNDNAKTFEQLRDILESGGKTELVEALLFTFESPDMQKYLRMVLTSKIIYMRIFNDARAREIFLSVMTSQKEDITKRVLDYGVEIGKFPPFDTGTYATFINECRHIMGIKAFARAEYQAEQLDEEQRLITFLANFLP